MERVGVPYTDVAQLIQDVLHHQVMEENNRYGKYSTRMLHVIRNNQIVEVLLRIMLFFFSLDNSTSNSPTSELNNLFNQVTIQMTNNSANKNGTQESDAFERDLEKKTDNESDDFSKYIIR